MTEAVASRLAGSNDEGFEVVVEAPVNIALVKYWGKRNEELVLPLNDSISLSINELRASTTISIGPHIVEDSVQLNGSAVDLVKSTRFCRVFNEVRNKLRAKNGDVGWKIRVVSRTNFPVAAGLASSAAGFAAIACGIGRALNFSNAEVARLARIGSGSACRSTQDGFIHWHAGAKKDEDDDCFCESIAPSTHWPQLRAVILMLSETRKKVGSTDGMRNTVLTSALLSSRVNELVPQRVIKLLKAINDKNFEELARITMAESNQLHAVCLDTFPPLNYLNDDSRKIMEFVHEFNAHFGEIRLAYTFDAGPNCCLILEEKTLSAVLESLRRCFKFDYNLLKCEKREGIACLSPSTLSDLALQDVIVSEVGTGPNFVSLKRTKVSDSPDQFTEAKRLKLESDNDDGLPAMIVGTNVKCRML